MWQNKKTQNVTRLKNKKCDKTKKINMWQNSKTLNVTKLKNSKCDKTQKLKIWQNLKTQNVTQLKTSKCDKTQKLKVWQNSKSYKVTKLKNSICKKIKKKNSKFYKTLNMTKLMLFWTIIENSCLKLTRVSWGKKNLDLIMVYGGISQK